MYHSNYPHSILCCALIYALIYVSLCFFLLVHRRILHSIKDQTNSACPREILGSVRTFRMLHVVSQCTPKQRSLSFCPPYAVLE